MSMLMVALLVLAAFVVFALVLSLVRRSREDSVE